MGDRFPAETPDGVEMVKKEVIDGTTVVMTDEEGETYQAEGVGTLVEQVDEPAPDNAAVTPLAEGGDEGDAPNMEVEGMNNPEVATEPIPAETAEPKAEFIEDITLEQNQADSMTEADEAPEVEEMEEAVEEAYGSPATLTASEADAQMEAAEPTAELAEDDSPEVAEVEEAVSEATDTEATLTASEAGAIVEEAEAAPADEAPEAEEAPAPDATPAAAELAREEGVDLSQVEGSGADGRILVSDVEDAAAEADQS